MVLKGDFVGRIFEHHRQTPRPGNRTARVTLVNWLFWAVRKIEQNAHENRQSYSDGLEKLQQQICH
jgi:hypothetical protein